MKIFNPSQNIILATTIFLVFIVPLRAQHRPQDFLAAHNQARAEVGVGPLRWDERVAAYARDYANKRKADCALQHSSGPYGENIAWSSGRMSGVEAVNMWVKEQDDYDYDSNTCAWDKVCGHYTQVVWRNSVKVGCAKVRCNNGQTFITCNYDPPGNWNGEWPY
uniref:Pathogenesis-related protein 1 n=1 Tax=Noccaea caerulescens TaxID=107243 RepID=A0A1J3E4A1_NOCCA